MGLKLPRFYVPSDSLNSEKIALPQSTIRHAVHVLRMKPGDSLVLFDGKGTDYQVKLMRGERDDYFAKVESLLPGVPLSKPRIILHQAPVKKERWEWLLEKATELGVFAIIPLMTRFTEVDAVHGFQKKVERWKMIVQSACEQSGRSILPELFSPVAFEEAISKRGGEKLLFFEGKAPHLKTILSSLSVPEDLSLFIGPEGGFSREEVDFAKSHDVTLVSLGKQILRAETAGIAAASILTFWFD